MRSDKPTAVPSIPADIEEVRRRLEKWRRKRKHGSRIPEDVWIAAAKLAKAHRPGTIAHALGLDYYCLKKRLDSGKEYALSASEARPNFFELVPSVSAPNCECTLELEHPRGAKMKIHVKGVTAADLAALSRALWSVRG